MPADDALDAALPQIADGFGLGETRSWKFLAQGLMNRNWRVETDTGSYAIKQIMDAPLAKVRRNLAVLPGLAASGLPIHPALTTADGERVIEVDGEGYCVLPWTEGSHGQGIDLDTGAVRDLGALLGRLHVALRDHEPAGMPDAPPRAKVVQPAAAVDAADALRAKVTAGTGTEFEKRATQALEQRKALLSAHEGLRPRTEVPAGPYGWTHGDFQYRNLLRRDDRVVAILDWDRLGVRPYAEEVARTAQVQFGVGGRFDLERVAAFVAGYRTVIDLPEADLADGLTRLWWKRMTDFWQLEFHLDRPADGFDAMFLADEELLHWWTGRLDEVRAAYAAR
ncbi:phosphotransferase [Streptomyces sp. NPDC058611]|uniref:phosphotransferase n=1 Tax=unclassified Streptomyces TaxID=2593676 RepID=UPI003664C0CD